MPLRPLVEHMILWIEINSHIHDAQHPELFLAPVFGTEA